MKIISKNAKIMNGYNVPYECSQKRLPNYRPCQFWPFISVTNYKIQIQTGIRIETCVYACVYMYFLIMRDLSTNSATGTMKAVANTKR